MNINKSLYTYGIGGLIVFIVAVIMSSIGSMEDGIDLSSLSVSNESSENLPEVGYTAPDFTFLDLTGNPVTLSKLKGKVILLNIWATWCGPCVAEMPSIEGLYNRFKSNKFEVLAISIDTYGLRDVEPFVKKMGTTFPILIDKKEKIVQLYRTAAIPQTFIIDKKGTIVAKILGARDWSSPKSYEAIEYLIEN